MNHEFNGTNAIDSLVTSQSGHIGIALERSCIIFLNHTYDRVDVTVPQLYFEKNPDDVSFYAIESNNVYVQQIAFSPIISKFGCIFTVLIGNHVLLYKNVGHWRCFAQVNQKIAYKFEINTSDILDSIQLQTVLINAFGWSGAYSSIDTVYKHAYLAVANDKYLFVYQVDESRLEYRFQVESPNIRSIAWCQYDIEETGFSYVSIGTLKGEFIVYRLDYPGMKTTTVFSYSVSSCIDLIQWYSFNPQNQVVSFSYSSKLSTFRLVANEQRNQFSEISHTQLPISRNPTILFNTSASTVIGAIGFLKEYSYAAELNRFNHDELVLKMNEKLLESYNNAHVENYVQDDINSKVDCYLSGCRVLGSTIYCHYTMRDKSTQESLQPNMRRSYSCALPFQHEIWPFFDQFMSRTENSTIELLEYSQQLQEFKNITKEDINEFSSLNNLLISNANKDTAVVTNALFDKRIELDMFVSLRKAINHFLNYRRKSSYLLSSIQFEDEGIEESRLVAYSNTVSVIEHRFIQLLGHWLNLYSHKIKEYELKENDLLFINHVISLVPELKYKELQELPKTVEKCPITQLPVELNSTRVAHVNNDIRWERCQVTLQIITGNHFKCVNCDSSRKIIEQGFLSQILQCFNDCLLCHGPMKAIMENSVLLK
eukprot:NODE_696_length_5082_cov_0.330724.p1 type:complete len:655 gc:universal NODE_696_length_5082_cov_0.330724:3376-1412(-)